MSKIVTLLFIFFAPFASLSQTSYQSKWEELPNMTWTGEELWANRLQDWAIENGKLSCIITGKNRSVALLTHQVINDAEGFEMKAAFTIQNFETNGMVGFRLASQGPNNDYRSAAVYGKGINVGLSNKGELMIHDQKSMQLISKEKMEAGFILKVTCLLVGDNKLGLTLAILDKNNGQLMEVRKEFKVGDLNGNLAVLSDFETKTQQDFEKSVAIENWSITGKGISQNLDNVYGPIYFVKYTLNDGLLKIAAQCAPTKQENEKAELWLKGLDGWQKELEAPIEELSRTALFRLDNWQNTNNMEYMVVYQLNEKRTYNFKGSIRPEPRQDEKIKLGLFSCNQDHGFPDMDLRENILEHKIDAALFLGDQFYEGFGGFGVEKTNLERSTLDYLRKWYMFGWSYRDVFRNVPMISIPDDHDVYHGNVWGEGGIATPKGLTGYDEQDAGGYKMPAEWVKMVQETQTGHLPEPYDPTPVKQNIPVYYTSWNWGPLSFAILEDRKFKSAPKNIFPPEAGIANGFITNTDFEIGEYNNPPNGQLYGERQEEFLENWTADWSTKTQFKVVLSQTNLATLATLPTGETSDKIVPSLLVPLPGIYPSGDSPTRDMDSNGWPHNKRNKAVALLRKGFALQLAGDQHLASVMQYGIDGYREGSFVFSGPALNNTWPRRWWPTLAQDHKPLEGKPAYTGDFEDGFKNKVTVHAVSNPTKTGLKPEIIYDRATGYGMVIFDPKTQEIEMECWPRYVDMKQSSKQQYDGWPLKIKIEDNYAKEALGYLPTINSEIVNPVVQLFDKKSKEVVYTRRFIGNEVSLKVFKEGKYLVKIGDSSQNFGKGKVYRFKVAK